MALESLARLRLVGAALCSFALGCAGHTDATAVPADASTLDEQAPPPGSRAPWCPESLPEAGTPCTPGPTSREVSEAPCEYGPDPHCTTLAECSSGAWILSPPVSSCSGNPTSCLPSLDAGPLQGCPVDVGCTYPDGRCACIECAPQTVCGLRCQDPDAGTEWYCTPWNDRPGCNPRPLLGTACDVTGMFCGDSWSLTEICFGGYWCLPSGGC